MLRKTLLGALVALAPLAALGGAAPQAAAEPTSYVLMCRGGGAMNYTIETFGTTARLIVRFRKAGQASSVQPPAPGECTWLDRPISGAEPSQLFADAAGEVRVACNSAGTCTVSGLPGGLQSLVNAMRSGGTFMVHVYNRGTGNFKVTRVGP
jgi:hypothetical protein